MKLLKKIAPLAIGALMLAAPLAGAVNIADWTHTFTSGSTAVVVGSGTIGELDMAAALTVAKAVGIDTTTPGTITGGENYPFEKASDKLNLGNNLTDIRSSLSSDQLPTILADGTYKDASSAEYDYTQKISVGTGISQTYFADSNYNDKTPVLGFDLASGTHILNYTLTFSDKPTFDDDTLDTSTINILGRDYYISDVSGTYAAGTQAITLLDSSTAGTVNEGATASIGGETITVAFIGTASVKLEIGGVTTNSLAVGSTYKLADGNYVGVKDIMYSAKDTGVSKVELTVGSGKIKIAHNANVKINDKTVEGLTGFITNSSASLNDLSTIILQWDLTDDSFVTPDTALTLPGLESVKLMTTGMVFPTGEEVSVGTSSDTASIKLAFKDGTKEIDLLHSNSTGFDAIGSDTDKLLATSKASWINYSTTVLGDKYFIASYNSSTDAESYLLSATFDNTNHKVQLHNEITGDDVCSPLIALGDCAIGDVDITVAAIGANDANFSINSGGSFDRVFTDNGLMIYLPTSTTGHGYVNTASNTTWVLEMVEQDKDSGIGKGTAFNLTFGHTIGGDVDVSSAGTTTLAGASFLKTADKFYTAYVKSDLASKIDWDKTADDYTATVTYYGEEVYGNVLLAGSGSSSGSITSWTAVKDSETSAYTGKNVIAIGGTAVNKVARKMLGLDEATPVFGSDSAWSTATGVDAVGKGILWIKTSPYNSGKYAMLVAGYEGADTEKTANFLTLVTPLPAKDKAVIDTVNNVEATA
jgi:hypothetical protein